MFMLNWVENAKSGISSGLIVPVLSVYNVKAEKSYRC